MLIAYPFSPKDESQALKNATWIARLKNEKNHKFLIVHDSHSNPAQIREVLSKTFEIAGTLSVRDHWNKWPESANNMFCETARYIEYTLKEPWLWCEPDTIPIKDNWLDKLESEYNRNKDKKPFMGGFVPKFRDSPDHMTGNAIYPGELIKYAGPMLLSVGEPCPFDLIAADQVSAQAHFTDLIQHRWSPPSNPNPPFTSIENIKERMTIECVLYHSDKTGSLIDILTPRHGTQTTDSTKCEAVSESPKTGRHSDVDNRIAKYSIRLENGCVEWTRAKYHGGYGSITILGRKFGVHRIVWEKHFGTIPKGMHVLHRCDNPPCINPEHLFLGTDKDNALDRIKKGRFINSGEKHREAKLNEHQVLLIRSSDKTGTELAREFGVTEMQISYIKRGKRWKHLGQLSLLERRREQAAKMRAAKAVKRGLVIIDENKGFTWTDNNPVRYEQKDGELKQVNRKYKEQSPWENKMDSICEINKLSQRLYKFCDAPMHIKRVRDELKKVGVIR